MAVLSHKVIKCLVEFRNQRFQPGIVLVLGLVLHHVCQCFLDGGVVLETLRFRVPLYLLFLKTLAKVVFRHVSFRLVRLRHLRLHGHGLAVLGNADVAVAVNHHAAFLHVMAELLVDVGGCSLLFGHRARLLCHERSHKLLQHLALVLAACRVESLARGAVLVALLETEAHLSSHVVGVLDEILVVVHRVLASLACARLLVLSRAFAADGAHVNGL